MKKILLSVICFALCISTAFAATLTIPTQPPIEWPPATSTPGTERESINLKGMTYSELVALKDQINLAIWSSRQWQEVTVPQGVWEVGKDIPAGHWTITAAKDAYCSVFYGEKLDDSGRDISVYSKTYVCEGLVGTDHWMYSANEKNFFDLNMKEGYFFVVESGNVVFSPYTGKPSLGFK